MIIFIGTSHPAKGLVLIISIFCINNFNPTPLPPPPPLTTALVFNCFMFHVRLCWRKAPKTMCGNIGKWRVKALYLSLVSLCSLKCSPRLWELHENMNGSHVRVGGTFTVRVITMMVRTAAYFALVIQTHCMKDTRSILGRSNKLNRSRGHHKMNEIQWQDRGGRHEPGMFCQQQYTGARQLVKRRSLHWDQLSVVRPLRPLMVSKDQQERCPLRARMRRPEACLMAASCARNCRRAV